MRNKKEKTGAPFAVCKNFYILAILIPLALIFTQAMPSGVSTIIFIFLCMLPMASLLYLIPAFFAIKLNLRTSSDSAEKFTPVSFSLMLSNESPFPFPFLEADITVPGDDAVKCEKVKTRLSLIPFGRYTIEKQLSFSYRGLYEIGVAELYCYDLFRLFKVKININLFKSISILPRRLVFSGELKLDDSTEESDFNARRVGEDNSEISDFRDYRPGDSVRAVHWKLSSKSDDLVVKEYSMNSKQNTLIICDTTPRYNPEESDKFSSDINEAAIDLLVEGTIAVGNAFLSSASPCTLVWLDKRSADGFFSLEAKDVEGASKFYNEFSTVPVAESDAGLPYIASKITVPSSARVIIATSSLNPEFVEEARAAAEIFTARGIGKIEYYAFIPYDKINHSHLSEFAEMLKDSKATLEAGAPSVVEPQLKVAKGK